MVESGLRQVVVLGKGELAIRVADWFVERADYELRWVVPVIPEPSWTSSISTWARARGVALIESGRWQDLPEGWRPDLAVSIFCHQIFPASFIARCGRIINLHNSPLPRYRGVTPINWALKNGERSHGVTLHEVTERLDAGPILDQLLYPIDPDEDEVIDVYTRALEHGWTLMARALPTLDRLRPQPQDESRATQYTQGDLARLGDRRWFTRAEHRARDEPAP